MKNFLTALLMLGYLTSMAKNVINENEEYVILYKAIYSVSLLPDSSDSNSRLSNKLFTLFIGNQISIYADNKKFKIDSILNGVKNGSINMVNVFDNLNRMPKPTSRSKIFKEFDKKALNCFEELNSTTYLYTEKLNIINWNIQKDTITINNYNCQKATGNYAGRSYIAWFASEIPIPDGPYKFNGLPGLIIKIYDTKEQYIFELKHFQKVYNIKKSLDLTSKPINTSKKEYLKFKDEFFSNPIPFLESEGMVFDQQNENIIREKFEKRKQRNNNPIELIVE